MNVVRLDSYRPTPKVAPEPPEDYGPGAWGDFVFGLVQLMDHAPPRMIAQTLREVARELSKGERRNDRP